MADLADSQSVDSTLPDTTPASHPPMSRAPEVDDMASADTRGATGARRTRWAIALLVALFLVTLWQRDTIRAHWWASRLMSTDDLSARGQYLSYLATVGEQGTGAVWRLARDDRPEVRALVVFAATKLHRPTATQVLRHLLYDANADVRDAAGRALVFTLNESALSHLNSVSKSPDAGVAASAVANLARLDSPAVADCLTMAGSHASPEVRAQMVESASQWIDSTIHDSSRTEIDPTSLLVRLAELAQDDSVFYGDLSMEREIGAVARFVLKSGPVVCDMPPPEQSRRISNIALARLSHLAGRTIGAQDVSTSQARNALVRAILDRLQAARFGPHATTLPIDVDQEIENHRKPRESTP